MLWPNLKNMKCPKCGNKIQVLQIQASTPAVEDFYKCDSCPFTISFTKFDEVVQSLYSGKRVGWMEESEKNQSDLNNL